MNLINRLHLFAATSRGIALGRARSLEDATGNNTVDNTKFVNRGNVACNFNFTDEFLADEANTEVYSYVAGDVCAFPVTTVSYIIDPLTPTVYKGDNSNTFELRGSHHLAVMKTDDLQKVYCYEDAVTVSNSTQYQDGSATFEITGGEIAIAPQNIGAWTTISVNGGETVYVPGFYYVEDGLAAGDVIFKDEAKMETEANYTKIEGTLVDLCEATNPMPSSAFAKSALLAGAMLPASFFFLL